MIDQRHRVFTEINRLFLLSAALFFIGRLLTQKILINLPEINIGPMFALSIGLLSSYLPYFIKNNFGEQQNIQKEKLRISKSKFILFAIIILFFNVMAYFFTSGIDNSFNSLGHTIFKGELKPKDVSQTVSLILYSIIIAPIIEELIYRGFIQDRLKKYGDVFAIVVSSLLFGIIHGNIPQFITSFLLGLVLGYVYLVTNSVKTTIFLHMFNNAYVTLYNELLFKNITDVDVYQIILIVELIVIVFLAIYAILKLRKDPSMQIKSNVKIEKSNSSYRIYFLRITTIFIFILFTIIMVTSINRIGG